MPYEGYDNCLRNELALSIIERENQMTFDLLDMQVYFEDGDEAEESPESNALLQKIGRGIRKILDQIIRMIENFRRAITNIGKEHMSAEEYIQTKHGTREFHQRCGKIAKEIDETFLGMRPIINAVSNVTDMDPAFVEKLCDGLNRTVEKANWGPLAQAVLKQKFKCKQISNGSYENKIRQYKARILRSEAEITRTKSRIKNKRAKLRALNKSASLLGRISAKIFGSAKDSSDTAKT